jgi:GNAT superfamily N-acetyltransferase
MTSLGKLERLDASNVTECAKVMAQAFSDSPSYNYIFQGTQEYRKTALEWLFQKNLDLMMAKCAGRSSSDSVLRGVRNSQGEVVCCFLWVPSQYAQLSMWDLVSAGMWQVPFRFGLSTLKRLLSLLDSMEAATGKVSSDKNNDTTTTSTTAKVKQNYIMLERMVVRPDHQGQGAGSHALQEILREATESQNTSGGGGGGGGVHLETQEERNVRFYQKLGWEVTYHQDYCEDEPDYKFHSWHMVRKA